MIVYHKQPARIDIIAAICVVVLLLAVCTCRGNQSTLIDLVPSDSCALVVIDWPTVRADSILKRAFNGDQLEAILQEPGIDGGAVRTIAIFSALDSYSEAGMLLRGTFHKQTQLSALKMRGWREETAAGHQLFVRGRDYIAAPQANTLFAGTRSAALAVFQALDERFSRNDDEGQSCQSLSGYFSRNPGHG